MSKVLLVLSLMLGCNVSYSQDSLKLHLNFDGDFHDASNYNYHGNTRYPLKFKQDGCNEAIQIGNNNIDALFINGDVFNQINDFTISVLIKLDGLNSSNNLISCANSIEANEFIMAYNSYPDSYEDAWHMIINKVRYKFDFNKIVNDLKWHHITMTREGSVGKLYIDGELIGNPIYVDDKKLDVAVNGFVLGQDQDCVSGCFQLNQSWFGGVDELKIFSKALNETEIEKLSCLDCSGVPNGKAILDTCGICLEPNHKDFNQLCATDLSIYIPRSFSPNEDGLNDLFRVFAADGIVKRILRYELYGSERDLLFKKADFKIESNLDWWDGRFRGERVLEGVYLYEIEVLFFNDEIRTYRSEVSLLR